MNKYNLKKTNEDWKEQLSWVGNLNINHIDLHEFLPNYSSDVSGTIKQSIKKHSFKKVHQHRKFDWNFKKMDKNKKIISKSGTHRKVTHRF